MRLNRYLSLCGLGSRRGCEQLVQEGRVSINGHVIKDLATQVSDEDRVVADGRPVKAETSVVIALNKPRGYICSRSDEKDRMTIYSLLPKQYQTLHHVGRLDKDSEGLLLMTNRGELSHRLIHPSMGAEKEYEVIVDKPMDQNTMAKLVKGMLTEEGQAKCERAWMMTEYRAHVVLKQGLKRQIRLMFYQLGFEVERLTRTRIGWLELKGLQKGGWKQLSETEVERFFSKDGATGRPSRQEKTKGVRVVRSGDGVEDDSPAPRRTVRKTRAGGRTDSDERPRGGRSTGSGSRRGSSSRTSRDEDAPRTRGGPSSRFSRDEGAPRSRSGSSSRASRSEDSPRSRGGKSPSEGRGKSRKTGSGRNEDTPRVRRSGGPSRPQRASIKRSSGKKGSR